jgi:hypothetical protein
MKDIIILFDHTIRVFESDESTANRILTWKKELISLNLGLLIIEELLLNCEEKPTKKLDQIKMEWQ